MKIKLLFLAVIAIVASGCQFTETMVLHADGSGTMSMELNLNEMMAYGGMTEMDSAEMKMDTIIYVKDFLEEKRDSISRLSKTDQQKLKKLENYKVNINIDSEEQVMKYDISIDFKNVGEANDILNALEQVKNFGPSSQKDPSEVKKEDTPDIIGVIYSFENNTFKRDAFIKDKTLHQQQVDSLKQTEAFFGASLYTLNYTFPKKIKRTSYPDALFSNNRKTMVIQTKFIEYFKDPDLLDLEVELEDE